MENVQDIILEFARLTKEILGNRLTKIILYGSFARGDYTENSDIDIMILTTFSDKEIENVETEIFDLAFEFQMKYSVDISVVLKNEKQFSYWLGVLPFYDNVQREGIVVHG
ncbi:MAG: nucleotidyltransferase domain-containing protein [Muribaculaceae bacterium]|nr:nucleotidyltransferase domain-containing protein [Muribaculaceae bacterium]